MLLTPALSFGGEGAQMGCAVPKGQGALALRLTPSPRPTDSWKKDDTGRINTTLTLALRSQQGAS